MLTYDIFMFIIWWRRRTCFVCFYTIYSLVLCTCGCAINSRVMVSMNSRWSSWTQICVHITLYILYVREEFILFIFCFLILILNIYTVKNHFYYYVCKHFLPLYTYLCYKCFFIIIFIFIYFLYSAPEFLKPYPPASRPSTFGEMHIMYILFTYTHLLKNRPKMKLI